MLSEGQFLNVHVLVTKSASTLVCVKNYSGVSSKNAKTRWVEEATKRDLNEMNRSLFSK